MIVHVYSEHPATDAETVRRVTVAQSTWARQPWTSFPVADMDLPRVFRHGDRSYPYVKDLFDAAYAITQDEDIIVYTNADIMVRGDACAQIAAALQSVDACYAYRRDWHHRVLTPIPDADYVKGLNYAGSDLFAFRAGWWAHVAEQMPDMLIGAEAWDPVLRQLIDERNPPGDTEVKDVICHERHGSHWEDPKNRYKIPSQLHNLGLARVFFAERGIAWRKFGIP